MTIPQDLPRGVPRHVSLTPTGWFAILFPCMLLAEVFLTGESHYGVLCVAVWHWIPARFVPGDRYRLVFDAGIILIPALCSWQKLLEQSRLLMFGRAAVATLTWKDHKWYRLSTCVEFRILSGATCRTRVELHNKVLREREEIVIVYDSDHPKITLPYPVRAMRIQ